MLHWASTLSYLQTHCRLGFHFLMLFLTITSRKNPLGSCLHDLIMVLEFLEREKDKAHLPRIPICFKSGLQVHLVVSLSILVILKSRVSVFDESWTLTFWGASWDSLETPWPKWWCFFNQYVGATDCLFSCSYVCFCSSFNLEAKRDKMDEYFHLARGKKGMLLKPYQKLENLLVLMCVCGPLMHSEKDLWDSLLVCFFFLEISFCVWMCVLCVFEPLVKFFLWLLAWDRHKAPHWAWAWNILRTFVESQNTRVCFIISAN